MTTLSKIIISSASVVTAKVGANGFEVTNQEGLLETPDGSRNKFKFGVDPAKGAWPVGEYEFSGDSLHVDKYGRLQLRPIVQLVPLVKAELRKVG